MIEADLAEYLSGDLWYQGYAAETPAAPVSIGYFSPEFGITEVLPQYSGGLGILAGDHLKAASDLGVPIIGVGLLYRQGYFWQSLNAAGWQQERYPLLDPNSLPLTCCTMPAARSASRFHSPGVPSSPRCGWLRWAGCPC